MLHFIWKDYYLTNIIYTTEILENLELHNLQYFFLKRQNLIHISIYEGMISTKYCIKHFAYIIMFHPNIGWYFYFTDKKTEIREFKKIV